MGKVEVLKGIREILRAIEWPESCHQYISASITQLQSAHIHLLGEPGSPTPESLCHHVNTHHVNSYMDLTNHPAACGSTIWERATTTWDETTCPECLKHRPVDIPTIHHISRFDSSNAYKVACGVEEWGPSTTITKDWSKVTCPECLKSKPEDNVGVPVHNPPEYPGTRPSFEVPHELTAKRQYQWLDFLHDTIQHCIGEGVSSDKITGLVAKTIMDEEKGKS